MTVTVRVEGSGGVVGVEVTADGRLVDCSSMTSTVLNLLLHGTKALSPTQEKEKPSMILIWAVNVHEK